MGVFFYASLDLFFAFMSVAVIRSEFAPCDEAGKTTPTRSRPRLRDLGIAIGVLPTGRYYLTDDVNSQEHGSCFVVVATDAPLDSPLLVAGTQTQILGSSASSQHPDCFRNRYPRVKSSEQRSRVDDAGRGVGDAGSK